MAYDAATSNVVLFGGFGRFSFGDTWTWDGSTWVKQAPAAHPSSRYWASMAYDAATGTIVLFGGQSRHGANVRDLSSTWTWDGSTWVKQAPAAHPPARVDASMAYDTATRDTVLFGGGTFKTIFDDTWTWGDPG
jgi:hypothetical protein